MRRQRGVALIMVITVVAVITVAMAGMASREQVDIRRAGNLFDRQSAYLLTLGAEDLARAVLLQDRRDSENDDLSEYWAQPTPPFPVGDGTIHGRLEDLQGRFNVNGLIDAEGAVVERELKRFRRLLAIVELDPEAAEAVLDWIDRDGETRFPSGAEDDYYMSQNPGYRAANRFLVSPSELALIKGIGHAGYQKLAPYVSTLPEPTAINVNTAPAAVLAALVEGFGMAEGEALAEARGEAGYETLEAFAEQESIPADALDSGGLALASNYFLLDAQAEWGRARVRLFTILKRDGGKVVALLRGEGAY